MKVRKEFSLTVETAQIATLIDYATQIDPDYKGDVEELIAKALNQTTLEEFE